MHFAFDKTKGWYQLATYQDCAARIAALVEQKQEAYGDSFRKSGDIMRILYPDGIPAAKLNDALTVVRIVDKLFRIATRRDAFGESPWDDITGYGLLAMWRRAVDTGVASESESARLAVQAQAGKRDVAIRSFKGKAEFRPPKPKKAKR